MSQSFNQICERFGFGQAAASDARAAMRELRRDWIHVLEARRAIFETSYIREKQPYKWSEVLADALDVDHTDFAAAITMTKAKTYAEFLLTMAHEFLRYHYSSGSRPEWYLVRVPYEH